METMVVDRIEGDIAVCELSPSEFKNIPLSELPSGIKEGSVLSKSGIFGKWTLDSEAEANRSDRISAKMNSLFK